MSATTGAVLQKANEDTPKHLHRNFWLGVVSGVGYNVYTVVLSTQLVVAKTIPATRRGIYFAFRRFGGGLVGLLGGALVNASYATPGLQGLANQARSEGITLLPEFGMDPGIDLVLLGEAVRSLDSVEEIITYGAGFPEPAATGNPLKYKVTWTFEGVLKSYRRAGRVIREGQIVEIGATEMFRPEHLYEVELEGLGRLEAFPNGDGLKYAELLGLDPSGLRNLGRYVLR